MIQLPHPPTVPDDCPPHMVLGWRIVYPDLTSRGGFRWPFPGRWIDPVDDGRDWSANGKPCPSEALGGYCIAKTWSGASSASIRSQTCLLVAYDPGDVLGEDHEKVRVRRALVLDVFRSTAGLSRGADLTGAYLTGAYLVGADLTRADLTGAYLTGAYLVGTDLSGAKYTASTVWPAGVDPVARGAVKW